MTDLYLYAAAAITLIWFFVHVIAGGKEIAVPIKNAEELHPLVRAIGWMVWHMVSVVILLTALFFVLATKADLFALAYAATALCAGLALVGLAIPPLSNMSYKYAPQGFLFVPPTLLGLMAVWP